MAASRHKDKRRPGQAGARRAGLIRAGVSPPIEAARRTHPGIAVGFVCSVNGAPHAGPVAGAGDGCSHRCCPLAITAGVRPQQHHARCLARRPSRDLALVQALAAPIQIARRVEQRIESRRLDQRPRHHDSSSESPRRTGSPHRLGCSQNNCNATRFSSLCRRGGRHRPDMSIIHRS